MATEQELRKEIERLTSRVQELEAQEVEIHEIRSSGSVITQARPRAKPDVFSATETSFNDWLNHFELCARINGWSNEQACQQLAVCLRGCTQHIHKRNGNPIRALSLHSDSIWNHHSNALSISWPSETGRETRAI